MNHVHTDRYVRAETNGGWGFAAMIIGLAVACIVFATYVHQKTYKHPTDPTAKSIGHRAPEGAGSLAH
jgi:hypothetical protein